MTAKLQVEVAETKYLSGVWEWCSEAARHMACPSFFCSGDWLNAAAQEVGLRGVWVFLVKEGKEIRAVLPMLARKNLLGGRDLRLLGTDFYPDPLGLIARPEHREMSIRALKDYFQRSLFWDRIVLDWILEDEVHLWKISGYRTSTAPYRLLPEKFDDLLKDFKKKKRYNLRAGARRIVDDGGELVISESSSTHKPFLDALFALHSKRSAERSLNSSFESARVKELHYALVAHSGNVRFYGLRFDKKIIAVIYGFEYAERFFYYQVAHDPKYGDLSPGSVLLYLAIEDSCRRGLVEFNFLQGNEGYKGVWASEARTLYRGVMKRENWRTATFDSFDVFKGSVKPIVLKIRGLLKRGN